MFEDSFERITDFLIPQILRNKSNIAYKDLVNRPLPAYFWDFFDVIFNPKVAEMVQIGVLSLDHRGMTDEQDFNKKIRNTLKFSSDELTDLVKAGLDARLKFILTPAESVGDFIFDYTTSNEIRAQEIVAIIGHIEKLLENWGPMIHHSVKIIEPYISSKGNEELTKKEFIKILQNAIEKESSYESLTWVESSLESLDSLLQLDSAPEELAKIDMYESVLRILKSRGLDFWMPAIDIEHEIRDDFLNLETVRNALVRLNIFIDNRLLGPHHSTDLGSVDDEMEGFTDFLSEETDGIS